MELQRFESFSTESKEYKKAYNFVTKDIDGFKYLYIEHLLGIVNTFVHYRIPITDDTIEGMKSALEDYFWSGIEPDWATMEAEKWWTDMNADSFVEVPIHGAKPWDKEHRQTEYKWKEPKNVPKKLTINE